MRASGHSAAILLSVESIRGAQPFPHSKPGNLVENRWQCLPYRSSNSNLFSFDHFEEGSSLLDRGRLPQQASQATLCNPSHVFLVRRIGDEVEYVCRKQKKSQVLTYSGSGDSTCRSNSVLSRTRGSVHLGCDLSGDQHGVAQPAPVNAEPPCFFGRRIEGEADPPLLGERVQHRFILQPRAQICS